MTFSTYLDASLDYEVVRLFRVAKLDTKAISELIERPEPLVERILHRYYDTVATHHNGEEQHAAIEPERPEQP